MESCSAAVCPSCPSDFPRYLRRSSSSSSSDISSPGSSVSDAVRRSGQRYVRTAIFGFSVSSAMLPEFQPLPYRSAASLLSAFHENCPHRFRPRLFNFFPFKMINPSACRMLGSPGIRSADRFSSQKRPRVPGPNLLSAAPATHQHGNFVFISFFLLEIPHGILLLTISLPAFRRR